MLALFIRLCVCPCHFTDTQYPSFSKHISIHEFHSKCDNKLVLNQVLLFACFLNKYVIEYVIAVKKYFKLDFKYCFLSSTEK